MSEWIKCSERLPDLETDPSRVLIRTRHCGLMVASMGGRVDKEGKFLPGWTWGVINDIEFQPQDVTHWMHLPKRPTED